MPRPPAPMLAEPIPVEQFVREFERIWSRGPVAETYPKPRIIFSLRMEEIHRRNPRRFAESEVVRTKGGHRRRLVHFAPSVLCLPLENRIGLIAHECGHLLLWGKKNHTERDADRAARTGYGVEILYSRRWPGKGLQVGRLLPPVDRAGFLVEGFWA